MMNRQIRVKKLLVQLNALLHVTQSKFNHLLHFYIAVIKPVLEYCAPVWPYVLTKAQTQELESIQKRAIHIIFHFTHGMPYSYMLAATNLTSLSSRRDDLSRIFFSQYYQSYMLFTSSPSPTPI